MTLRLYNSNFSKFRRIQNMLGRVVNMDSPEKNPASSSTVKNRVRLIIIIIKLFRCVHARTMLTTFSGLNCQG